MARAAASVAPEVKTISDGRAPRAAATSLRAPSSRSRAARPAACTELGFPKTRSARSTAAIASGRTGVMALWSR
jgi:hypothetical protein